MRVNLTETLLETNYYIRLILIFGDFNFFLSNCKFKALLPWFNFFLGIIYIVYSIYIGDTTQQCYQSSDLPVIKETS